MLAVIARSGGRVRGVLYCPHQADDGCVCRKPRPGLLYEARDRFGLQLTDGFLVGDHPTDLEAGHRAGCRSILVLSGRTERAAADLVLQDRPACSAVVSDLLAAAEWIVTHSGAQPVSAPARDPAAALAAAGSARP